MGVLWKKQNQIQYLLDVLCFPKWNFVKSAKNCFTEFRNKRAPGEIAKSARVSTYVVETTQLGKEKIPSLGHKGQIRSREKSYIQSSGYLKTKPQVSRIYNTSTLFQKIRTFSSKHVPNSK